MTRDFIPERLEQLTPEWLTEALTGRGHLRGGRVREVSSELIGEGEGFLGTIGRLRLSYAGAQGDPPTQLIAKLPTVSQENRQMGEILGAYWREICFYEHLSDRVPPRTPAVYYSAFDEDPMRERQDGIVVWLDKLPMWMVNRMMTVSRRIVADKDSRYVLLMEDLAPSRPGDQVAGGTPERCARALDAVAGTHAAFWEDRELHDVPYLSKLDLNPRMRHKLYLNARRAFDARYPKLLDGGLRPIMEWYDKRGVKVARALHSDAPTTLVHGDFRFDNIFFHSESDPVEIAIADWQLVGRGAAAYDVAYLLTGALRPEVSRDTELELLRGYHARLVDAGVDYPFERLARDYDRALLAVLGLVSSTDDMEMGDDRGVDLMDLWVERTHARVRHVDLSTVL